jgi:hypothetical protein
LIGDLLGLGVIAIAANAIAVMVLAAIMGKPVENAVARVVIIKLITVN